MPVKRNNFTKRIILPSIARFAAENYRFSVLLESNDCNAVLTLSVNAETA